MANDTISQIKIAGTTYDICDVETKRNSGYAILWKQGFHSAYSAEQYVTVNANSVASLGYLFDGDIQGCILGSSDSQTVSSFENINSMPWPYMNYYPCFYQIMLHTISTADNYAYKIELQNNSQTEVIHSTYIKKSTDTVSVFSGFIPYGPAGYEVLINPETKLSKVWGSCSLLIYKTALEYPFINFGLNPVHMAEE